MDAKKLALLCREFAENKKAEDPLVLDMREVSSVADYFVLVSGTSQPHLRAISDEITEQLKKQHGLAHRAQDGSVTTSSWLVLDYFDVIVHVMSPETRSHYDLEGLWGDAPRLKPPRKPKPKLQAATAGPRH